LAGIFISELRSCQNKRNRLSLKLVEEFIKIFLLTCNQGLHVTLIQSCHLIFLGNDVHFIGSILLVTKYKYGYSKCYEVCTHNFFIKYLQSPNKFCASCVLELWHC